MERASAIGFRVGTVDADRDIDCLLDRLDQPFEIADFLVHEDPRIGINEVGPGSLLVHGLLFDEGAILSRDGRGNRFLLALILSPTISM